MTNKKEKRISPYADRAALQRASARKYRDVDEEGFRLFQHLQYESYLVWQELWEGEEVAASEEHEVEGGESNSR
jgi:hypothetical protein